MNKFVGRCITLFLIAGLTLGASAARAQNEIKIGAFIPATGIMADAGAQIRAAIELAIERANAVGLVLDKPYKVNVIWYDDEGKADVALNAVTRALTVDKINFGVGFTSSDIFSRVMDEFQNARVPLITCCAASLGIGDKIA